MQEAIRLFTVATMDAAKSGINQQINLTAEMANEIKVCNIPNSYRNKKTPLFSCQHFAIAIQCLFVFG